MVKRNNRHGFTIAELLIVVAIIAVLVAIAIPVFGNILENSREATDAANIRSSYAEAVAKLLAMPADEQATHNASNPVYAATQYKIQQQKDDWDSKPVFTGPLSDFFTTKSTDAKISAGSNKSIQVGVYATGGEISVACIAK